MHKPRSLIGVVALLCFTLLSGIILSAPLASADTSDTVNIAVNVPAACTLTPTSTSLTQTIAPGTPGNIGTANLKAVCNDAEGFAIYAVGYTNNEYGNTDLITELGTSHSIHTGTGTSTSNWNMTIDNATTTGNYDATIENDFDEASDIPETYTKIATVSSATDQTIGTNLTADFNAYIAPTQPAGTYTGKVKFTLVHPSVADEPIDDNQVAVIYDGNGLTFEDGSNTNRVLYEYNCEDQYGYVGNTAEVIKTVNLDEDGVQDGNNSYVDNIPDFEGYYDLGSAYFEGATGIKVEVTYRISQYSVFYIYDSNWNIVNGRDDGKLGCYIEDVDGCSGTTTYYIEGDYISIGLDGMNGINPNYNYGVYAKAYPVYETEEQGTNYELTHTVCNYSSASDNYDETTTWFGRWQTNDGWRLYNEDDVIDYYLNELGGEALGATLRLYAYYPYRIVYNGNQATVGAMQGFYTTLDTTGDSNNLLAPNFLRTNYGFAGWSEDSTATANGNSKIYGPAEEVEYSDLTFDSNKTATLYAVWEPSAGNLQGWTGCSSMSTGDVTALTDTRDGNTYAVAKYGNGSCWIMENLRLNPTDINTSITSDNTNGPTSDFLTKRQSIIGSSSIRVACSDSSVPECVNRISFDNGFINTSLTPHPTGQILNYTTNSYDDASWLSHGVLYNWYTATAGNGNYDSVTDASGDICPVGWHLPNGSTDAGGDIMSLLSLGGEVNYDSLYYRYEVSFADSKSNIFRAFPYNQIGCSYNGVNDCLYIEFMDNSFAGGELWTSSVSNYRYDSKTFTNWSIYGRLTMSGNNSRNYTLPIRCLAN